MLNEAQVEVDTEVEEMIKKSDAAVEASEKAKRALQRSTRRIEESLSVDDAQGNVGVSEPPRRFRL